MNIAPINSVTNKTFFTGTSEKKFTNSQLNELEQNKDLIDALYIAGVIEQANLNMINNAIKAAKIEENMQYILENITSPKIEKNEKELHREEQKIEYDDFTDIYYNITFQDNKLETALKFIKEQGDIKEYNQLLNFRENNKTELDKTEKAINASMNNMEKETRDQYQDNNSINLDSYSHTIYHVDNIIKNNPITTLNDTIAALKDKLQLD